jgi:outer membrane protein assembly factor BamB/predicted phosphodiesterase
VLLALTIVLAAEAALEQARLPERQLTGVVYDDQDGDGVRDPGEPPVAGVLVVWEQDRFTRSDAQGAFAMPVPGEEGLVWAGAPSGFAPAPAWAKVPSMAPARAELGLRQMTVRQPLRFVHASDPHVSEVTGEGHLTGALAQALDLDQPVDFVVITGDLTDRTERDEFAVFQRVARSLPVPLVPVAGNHDWYDGGPAYRDTFGPATYSFDAGDLHGIVLNFNAPEDWQLDFVRRDLALAGPRPVIAVFTHAPPGDELAAALAELGVDLVFSGHVHSNRLIQHGPMLEVNTQTLVMGGNDGTPAGYRIVELDPEGVRLDHFVTLRWPVLELAWPRPGACIVGPTVPLLVAEARGAHTASVRVQINQRPELELSPAGTWLHAGHVADLPAGRHAVRVRALRNGLEVDRRDTTLCVLAPGDEDPRPLTHLWAVPLGAPGLGGSPVIHDGLVIVPVADLDDGKQGGLRALDAATGALRWQAVDGQAVRATPVIAGERVLYTTVDGKVRARALADGALVWTSDRRTGARTADTWLYGPPAVEGGQVIVTTVDHVAALDLATGAETWRQGWNTSGETPVFQVNPGGAGLAGGLGLAHVRRVPPTTLAFSLADGRERWRVPFDTGVRVSAPPLVTDDLVVFADGQGTLHAIDLATGAPRWTSVLYDAEGHLSEPPMGAPVVHGQLGVWPTPRGVFAVDLQSGAKRWWVEGGPSVLRALPYSLVTHGFMGGLALDGELVWAGGVDGQLRALSLADGGTVVALDLGSPILTAPALSDDLLVVLTYDGAVRAFRRNDLRPRDRGCEPELGAAPAGVGLVAAVLAAVAAWLLLRRRPRRRVG